MTVLVTGAAGFVGSAVARQLAASGTEVAAVVRPGSARPRLDGVGDAVRILECDLDDGRAIKVLLESVRPEACIHAGWYAEPGKYLDSPRNLESLRSSLTLLEILGAVGCRHLVGVGTCFEYEMQSHPLNEDSVTKPFTLYAACKLAFHLVGTQRAAQLGVEMAWARLFYLYGPREDERRLVPAAITALRGGHEFKSTSGTQVRDYLHIEDVASALCALSRGRLTGAFNISSGRPVTIADLLEVLSDLVGRRNVIRLGAYPDRPWDPAHVVGDNHRLKAEAGWSPRFELREGLADTIAWWSRAQESRL